MVEKKKGGGFWRLEEEAPPFLTDASVKFIEKRIDKSHNILEFGSGGSTVFFARRARKVISFESGGYIIRKRKLVRSLEWYTRVMKKLKKNKIDNVELYLLQGYPDSATLYSRLFDSLKDEYFHWVLIDGANRKLCLDRSRDKLISGGFMVIDNYDHIPPENTMTSKKVFFEHEYISDVIDTMLKGWEYFRYDEPGWAGKGTIIYRKP